jgi:hypothetical protein
MLKTQIISQLQEQCRKCLNEVAATQTDTEFWIVLKGSNTDAVYDFLCDVIEEWNKWEDTVQITLEQGDDTVLISMNIQEDDPITEDTVEYAFDDEVLERLLQYGEDTLDGHFEVGEE